MIYAQLLSPSFIPNTTCCAGELADIFIIGPVLAVMFATALLFLLIVNAKGIAQQRFQTRSGFMVAMVCRTNPSLTLPISISFSDQRALWGAAIQKSRTSGSQSITTRKKEVAIPDDTIS